MAQNLNPRTALVALGSLGSLYLLKNCIFTVQPGQNAILYSRITGLKNQSFKEGWNFCIPYFERPIIYNIQTRPTIINATTANRDMQNVNLAVRVLFRPKADKLVEIYRLLGLNFDERVLPSLVNEVLKTVVAQYSASQLLSQRDQVSSKIRKNLEERAKVFHILIDDVSITDLHFMKEYTDAIEGKQVAQQDAERAKYVVDQALETKKSAIIKAQGEAKSIELLGKAAMDNPSYLEIRKLDYAREISTILSQSVNNIYLNSDSLQLNLNEKIYGSGKK